MKAVSEVLVFLFVRHSSLSFCFYLSFLFLSVCSVPEAGGTFHQFPKLGHMSLGAPCFVEKTVLQ